MSGQFTLPDISVDGSSPSTIPAILDSTHNTSTKNQTNFLIQPDSTSSLEEAIAALNQRLAALAAENQELRQELQHSQPIPTPSTSQQQRITNPTITTHTPIPPVTYTTPSPSLNPPHIPTPQVQPEKTFTTAQIPQDNLLHIVTKLVAKQLDDHKASSQTLSLHELCSLPFPESIISLPLPPNSITPQFTLYDGTGKPRTHKKSFLISCVSIQHNDALLLQLFPQSLTGLALTWFANLLSKSITSFLKLSRLFINQFAYNLETEVTLDDLANMKQKHDETFTQFYNQNIDLPRAKRVYPTSLFPSNSSFVFVIVTRDGFL